MTQVGQRERKTNRQKNGQTDRGTDGQTERQTLYVNGFFGITDNRRILRWKNVELKHNPGRTKRQTNGQTDTIHHDSQQEMSMGRMTQVRQSEIEIDRRTKGHTTSMMSFYSSAISDSYKRAIFQSRK